MQNAKLDEAQAGIKIAGKNMNNLRYADNTTLVAESEEKLKSLSVREKEKSEQTSLKLSIKKKKKLRLGILVPSLHGKYKGKKWRQ